MKKLLIFLVLTLSADAFGASTAPIGRSIITDPTDSTIQAGVTSTGVKVDLGSQSLTVNGSAVTQPVSAASLPLPAGAATVAKQPALGTAGTASADVITVQGVTSMTPLKTDGSGVTQPVSGTFWPATQPVSGTTTANQGGTWTVQPGNTANTTAWKVDGSAVTQPVSGTFWQATQPVSGTVTINAIPTGSNLIGQVTSLSTVITATAVTRPGDTTTYTSGDLIANSTTNTSVTNITLAVARANDTTTSIRRARLSKSTTTTTNAQFRAHFWRTAPGNPTNGDNGALAGITNNANYLGYIDFDMTSAPTVNSDGVKAWGAPAIGSEILCLPSSGTQNIFALLEARAAYAPGNAETFTLSLEVLQD